MGPPPPIKEPYPPADISLLKTDAAWRGDLTLAGLDQGDGRSSFMAHCQLFAETITKCGDSAIQHLRCELNSLQLIRSGNTNAELDEVFVDTVYIASSCN